MASPDFFPPDITSFTFGGPSTSQPSPPPSSSGHSPGLSPLAVSLIATAATLLVLVPVGIGLFFCRASRKAQAAGLRASAARHAPFPGGSGSGSFFRPSPRLGDDIEAHAAEHTHRAAHRARLRGEGLDERGLPPPPYKELAADGEALELMPLEPASSLRSGSPPPPAYDEAVAASAASLPPDDSEVEEQAAALSSLPALPAPVYSDSAWAGRVRAAREQKR